MAITIINDCRDANAQARQVSRAGSLFNAPVSFVGVTNDIEAAGNLMDVLDAYDDQSGVVLVNVAPRNGVAKKWENGTPFGYFWYRNVLCVASIDGYTLSLAKQFSLFETIDVLDITSSLKAAGYADEIAAAAAESQFRSFDFLPRIAHYLSSKPDIATDPHDSAQIVDIPDTIWWIDNFGNAKTTRTDTSVSRDTETVATSLGALPFFWQLRDVPENTLAVVRGSSGIGDTRFLEIVMQGESAAAHATLSVGMHLS